jgi:hypothetical protein
MLLGISKLRRMSLVGCVPCMKEIRNAYNILVMNLQGRDHLRNIGVNGRIMLKWIIKKYGWI